VTGKTVQGGEAEVRARVSSGGILGRLASLRAQRAALAGMRSGNP
jgi:hypothetical protein